MRNNCAWLLYLTTVLAAPLASANPSSVSGINVGELALVQSQTILFKAQAERARAEESITGGTDKSGPLPQPATLPAGVFPIPAPIRPIDLEQDLPVVKAVYGSGKRLRATLLYSGGFEIDVEQSSQELPGGYRVAILNIDNVTLKRGEKRFPLGFSTVPPVTKNSPVQPSIRPPGSVGLPGMHPALRGGHMQ